MVKSLGYKTERFQILKECGRSTFGDVFRARDMQSDTIVTLVEIPTDEHTDTDSWYSEFRLLMRLKHPGLLPILEAGPLLNTSFFYTTAALPDLVPLTQIPDDLTGNPDWMKRFIGQVIDALSFLHASGILHLDLNPENILLLNPGGDMKVQIANAGVYQVLPPDRRLIRSSYSPYSISYMSPEQLTRRKLDQTSDLYSFGVVLYELISKTHPFKLDSYDATLSAHLNRVPTPLQTELTQVFKELGHLVLQMLAKEPSFRPASFDELAVQLKLRPEPVSAPCFMSNGFFVGQELPRKEVQTAFEEACVGNSKILIVGGQYGIGKSRFLDEMKVEMESSGARIIEISASIILDDSRETLRSLFTEIKKFYPKLQDGLTDLIYCANSEDPLLQISDPQYLKASHRQAANLLTHAMALTESNMEDPPLVIILKNFHSEETIPWLFLNEVNEQWQSQIDLKCPVLWLVESHAAILEELQRTSLQRFNHIDLIPLNMDETAILLSSLLNITPIPDAIVQPIHEASRGIPNSIKLVTRSIFLLKLIAWHDGAWTLDMERFEAVPFKDGHEKLVKYQQANLESDAKTLCQHASLWERPCTYAELLMTIEDSGLIERTLNLAIGIGMLQRVHEDGSIYYTLGHPIFRSLVHSSLAAYERVRLHTTIYTALSALPESLPDRLSIHAFEADKGSEGCEHATRAAQRFYMIGDYANAARWYRIAIDRMPDRNRTKLMQLSYELGHALIILHRFSESLQCLEEANPIMESRVHQKREKAHYLMMIGISNLMLQKTSRAIDSFGMAVEYLPRTTCHDIRMKIIRFYVNALNSIKRYTQTIELVNQNIKDLPVDDMPYFSGDIYYQLSIAYFELKQFLNSDAAVRRSIMLTETLGNPLAYLDRYIHLGRTCQELARLRDAASEFEKVIAVARRGGDLTSMTRAMTLYASLKMKQSNYDDASVLLDQANRYARSIADPILNIEIMNRQGQLNVYRGRLTEAFEALNKALSFAEMTPNTDLKRRLLIDLSGLEDIRGNHSGAIRYENLVLEIARKDRDLHQIAHAYFRLSNLYIRTREWLKAQQFTSRAKRMFTHLKTEFLELDISQAEIAFARNETNSAQSIASRVYTESKGMLLSRSYARANRLLGQIAAQRNLSDKAKQFYLTAIKLFEGRGDLFEVGLTFLLVAEMNRQMGDIEEARKAYTDAIQFFRRVGTEYYRDKTEKAIHRLTHPQAESENTLMDHVCIGVNEMIRTGSDQKKLFERFLDVLISVTEAERAMLILVNPNGTAKMQLARNVEQRVMRDVTWIITQVTQSAPMFTDGCLIGNAPSDNRVSGLKSVAEGLIFSLICQPIQHHSSILGAVYLDSKRSFDVFTSPHASLIDHLSTIIFTLSDSSIRSVETSDLKTRADTRVTAFDQFLGESRYRDEILSRVNVFSAADTPVLITGLPGTGRDRVAIAVHESSARRAYPFKQINCASIPDSLVDNELFGCTSGTEYRIDKSGQIEMAEGGTLHLKDIERTSLATQNALAHCIETAEFHRLGSNETKTCNLRFIFSTTRDLRIDVQNGAFSDVLYRLIGKYTLKLPTLSEYREEIPILVRFALDSASKLVQKRFTGFEPKAIEALIQYPWPRNIDELNESIRNASVAAMPPVIEFKDLPHSIRVLFAKSGATVGMPELKSMDEVEEAHIRAILSATGGNKLRACEVLQVSRPTLDRKLERYNISVKKTRKDQD